MQKSLSRLPDLTALFERYEALCREADAIFAHVREKHGECVACEPGCADCCSALFDLPLIEAVYINHAFRQSFPSGAQRSALLDAADAADRAIHKIKRRAFKDWQSGRDENAIMAELGRERVRCPLLGDDARCSLYHARPLTCRVYGIPLNIGGKGQICGKSRFASGNQYPAVHLDVLRGRLAELSGDLARHVQSGYDEVHTVLVPLSMALLTEYDATYFGVGRTPSAGRAAQTDPLQGPAPARRTSCENVPPAESAALAGPAAPAAKGRSRG